MSEKDTENLNSTNQETEDSLNPNEGGSTEETPEEKIARLEGLNTRLFERAKKAEGFVKQPDGTWIKKPKPEIEKKPEVKPTELPPSSDGDLSTKDVLALIEAKVPQEDIDEVRDFATFKKISVSEALKLNVVKTMLSERLEERKTAAAASTGAVPHGTSKTSDAALLEKANKGELPESHEDMVRLIKAKKGLK